MSKRLNELKSIQYQSTKIESQSVKQVNGWNK